MPQQADALEQQLSQFAVNPIPSSPTAPPSKAMTTLQSAFPAAAEAGHQLMQIPQGVMDIGRGLSPIDMSQGWGSPHLQVPPTVQGILQMAAYPETAINLLKPFGTLARETGALVAPNSVNMPSQEDMDQATRGMTQNLAGLLGARYSGEVGPAIQRTATKAGIPQMMAETATAPLVQKSGLAPILRAGARRLYSVPEPISPPPIQAEFVDKPQPDYMDTSHIPIQRPGLPPGPPAAPEVPPSQLGPGTTFHQPEGGIDVEFKTKPTGQLQAPKLPRLPAADRTQVAGTAPSRPQITSGTGAILPGGNTPVESPDLLPAHYQNIQAPTPPSTMGGARLGEEGGIPARNPQDIIGVRVPQVSIRDEVTGKFRRMTDDESAAFRDRLIQEHTTAGKSTAPAPPEPPAMKPKPKTILRGK